MTPIIFARITKVDEARQEVTGRAVAEEVDRSDEVFDYDTSKPEFLKWNADTFADSNGLSHGNVRAMHGNVCAGKLTDINFNDVEKCIDVTAKIVDPTEWNKIIEGCYSGFSIGGRYARKWPDVQNGKTVMRYTAVPSEISIVDRPCVQSAKFHNISKNSFQLIKRDGSIERRAFGKVEPCSRDPHRRTTEFIRKRVHPLGPTRPAS